MRYFIIITMIFIFTNANASFGDWFSSFSKRATPVVEKPIVKTIDKPVKRPLVNINTEELVLRQLLYKHAQSLQWAFCIKYYWVHNH
jgi:hypothetical protein